MSIGFPNVQRGNALLDQRLDHLEPPPPSPSGYELSGEDHLPVLKAALEMLLLQTSGSATVLVPFAPFDRTYAFDLLLPDRKSFWFTATTSGVFLEWQNQSAEYRKSARQRFEQIRDPNV